MHVMSEELTHCLETGSKKLLFIKRYTLHVLPLALGNVSADVRDLEFLNTHTVQGISPKMSPKLSFCSHVVYAVLTLYKRLLVSLKCFCP